MGEGEINWLPVEITGPEDAEGRWGRWGTGGVWGLAAWGALLPALIPPNTAGDGVAIGNKDRLPVIRFKGADGKPDGRKEDMGHGEW